MKQLSQGHTVSVNPSRSVLIDLIINILSFTLLSMTFLSLNEVRGTINAVEKSTNSESSVMSSCPNSVALAMYLLLNFLICKMKVRFCITPMVPRKSNRVYLSKDSALLDHQVSSFPKLQSEDTLWASETLKSYPNYLRKTKCIRTILFSA